MSDSAWPRISYFDAGTPAADERLRELVLLDRQQWVELYRRARDGTHWRIDADDRYQQRFLVRIDELAGWASFDASALEMQLLLAQRGGLGTEACVCAGCHAPVLLGSAFCLPHSHAQGLRR